MSLGERKRASSRVTDVGERGGRGGEGEEAENRSVSSAIVFSLVQLMRWTGYACAVEVLNDGFNLMLNVEELDATR